MKPQPIPGPPVFLVLKDKRTGGLFIERADSTIRAFEFVLARMTDKKELQKLYPFAVDITQAEPKE